MPTYTFLCKKCETIFEIDHGFDEPHPDECPRCGGPIERKFDPFAVLYKGSGFYTTDKVLSEPTEDEKIEAKLEENRT